MHWRKKRLYDSNLYLILDREVNSYQELFDIGKKAVALGVGIVQLRDKKGTAKDILDFSKNILKITKGRCLYVINDRVDLAFLVGADGVHLGQDDIDIKNARKVLHKDQLIGVSCQNLDHLKKAQSNKADYIGFGSIFKTQTKPGRNPMDQKILRKTVRSKIPVFAIGGIDLNNIEDVMALGVRRVAVCRAICRAKDVPLAIKNFSKTVNRKSR